MGRLAVRLASESVTATWQLSCLPSWPQYWRATPTECRPFLGKPVSSMIQASIAPLPSITGRVSNRQGQLLYPAENPFVRPRRVGDEMQQRLVLGRDPGRRRHRRDRLDALALARQQQAQAIIT